MPSQLETNLKMLQVHNPVDTKERSKRAMQPLSKQAGVLKETLRKPKVTSLGVNPIRKSADVDNLNVMLVGSGITDDHDSKSILIEKPKSEEQSLLNELKIPSQTSFNSKPKMPAILSSEGTTAKPGYAIRAKPPAMPRSRLKPKKDITLVSRDSPNTRHTTTPAMDEEKETKSERTFPESTHESNDLTESSKSVVSIQVTDVSHLSPSPVRSVDDMIQALRSSRQTSASHKSLSDQKIDDIMKQVMAHAQEWMDSGFTKEDRDEVSEPEAAPESERSQVRAEPDAPKITTHERIDETEIDVSDTVSTLASQISVPSGIPNVTSILTRKSSHAIRGQAASETSSPVMMVVPDDEDSFDREQAEKDFGLSLDVAYDDIISVQGSNPPLIEKPAVIFSDKAEDGLTRAPENPPFSYHDGGRVHRLCLLPSIDELNVTSDELALTKYLHANSDANVTSHAISTLREKKTEVKATIGGGVSAIKPTFVEAAAGYLDSSKLDPLDIDGWRKIVEGTFEKIDYTIAGSCTDMRNVAAWRLLSTVVPPKMALSSAAVKALVFPNYHGSKVIEPIVDEKESWTEDDELSEIIIDDDSKREYNERSIYRRHNSVETLSLQTESKSKSVRRLHTSDATIAQYRSDDMFLGKNFSSGLASNDETAAAGHDGNIFPQRSRSFPNLKLTASESDSLCLIKTDYSSAMSEIKLQMELALQQQVSEQELTRDPEPSQQPEYFSTLMKDSEQKMGVSTGSNILLPVPRNPVPPPTPARQSNQAVRGSLSKTKSSFVMLGKKQSFVRRNKRFAKKIRRSLESYSPVQLKRSRSVGSFFPLSTKESQQTFLTKKKTKSSQLPAKITRSTSIPSVCEFNWFVSRHSSYGEKIGELREWVRDIWNTWFDELFPPEEDEHSSEEMSEKPLESLDGLADVVETRKHQIDIRKVFIPDKIPSSVTFLFDDVEEAEDVVKKKIKELNKQLSNLPPERGVERACHLAKRGTLLRKSGEIKLAMDDLNQAIALEPHLVVAYWQRHLIHLLRHQKHDALDDLNALLKINNKNVHAFRSRADIFASLGDFTMAIVNYSQAIKLDPTNSETFYQRAKLFEKTGDMLLAMEDFSAVHQLKPAQTDALTRRALFYFNKKSWLVAIADLSELIEREPLNSIVRTFRARAFWELGHYENSLRDFSAAIHCDPRNTTAYYYRGALLRTTAPEQALQDLSVSLLLDNSEKNVLALLHRGILYSEMKRYNEALIDFEQTLKIDGSLVCAQVNIGIIQMTIHKNYWDAIKRFTSALKQNPTYTRAHVCRADAYAQVHDYKAAVRDVTRAIHLHPSQRHLYLRRGKYLLQNRQLKLAAFCVQHIATLEKSFVGNSATQQAVVQSFLGNHEEASKSLTLACRRQPVPSMYILLAKTLMKGKQFEEAMQNLRHALELTAIYSNGESKDSMSDEARIHFLLGQCCTEMGHHDEALLSYNDALKEESHYSEAFYQRGLCKLKLDIGSGIQDLNRALALNPDLFEAYLSRAAYYSTKQRFSKAILNCNEALRLRPLSVRALLCRGALKFCISAYPHSITDLTRAIELDKKCTLAYYNRAVCLHQIKKYQDALKDYSIVLVLSGNDVSEAGRTLKSRVFMNRALLYMQSDMQDAQNAAFDLENAAILEPGNTTILHAMAICYHKMQNLQGAFSAYTRCIEVEPNFLDAYVGRGDTYADAGRFGDAKREYERALKLDPTHVSARVHLGYNLHMCGYLQRAWVQFTAVLRQDPNCLSALEGRAITCLHARDYNAASRDVTVAMKCAPPSARLLTIGGVVHQQQKDFHTAMALYNKARELDPMYTPAHFNAAVLYLRDQRFSTAFDCLQAVIRSNPNDGNALLNRAIVRVFLKDPEGAMNDFNFALQLDPQNSHIYFNRGNLHFMLEEYDKAVADFSSAFDINPSDYVTLKRRADAKGKQGKKKDAVEDYQRSLTLFERHQRLRQLNKREA